MNELSRRAFLSRATVALSAGIAALVGLPILGYLLAPLFRAPADKPIPVGAVSEFPLGETKLVSVRDPSPLAWAGQTAQTALWVRRREASGPAMFQIFNVNCTHLGCPVNWKAEAKLFLCPCHGGVFYADGSVAGGPPSRPLFEREWEVSGDRLLVRQQGLPTVKRG
ncbi:MAG TPA: ubiquinol-cytochrome c reductase iron-sulfur subunit [Candidatus Limnocylindria bacterium]|nr:ubiquinol-cytochrome c reductase iron-sulfur subunit [Candidatus Limnocylindria bacterium]